jgi:hypothetical protein
MAMNDDRKPGADVSEEKPVLALAEMLAKEMGRKVIICFPNGEEVTIKPDAHPQEFTD